MQPRRRTPSLPEANTCHLCSIAEHFEYEGVMLENAFRLDMLVDGMVVVELKSVEKMNPVFMKQLKTYLVITNLKVGVVVNFGMSTLKEGFVRFVNDYKGQ